MRVRSRIPIHVPPRSTPGVGAGLIREKIAKKDPAFEGPITVYGEQSRITAPTLDRESVTFKQTPYDVKARR